MRDWGHTVKIGFGQDQTPVPVVLAKAPGLDWYNIVEDVIGGVIVLIIGLVIGRQIGKR